MGIFFPFLSHFSPNLLSFQFNIIVSIVNIYLAMVYISHGVDEPRAWQKPVSKVYDANRISGEFYYRVKYKHFISCHDNNIALFEAYG